MNTVGERIVRIFEEAIQSPLQHARHIRTLQLMADENVNMFFETFQKLVVQYLLDKYLAKPSKAETSLLKRFILKLLTTPARDDVSDSRSEGSRQLRDKCIEMLLVTSRAPHVKVRKRSIGLLFGVLCESGPFSRCGVLEGGVGCALDHLRDKNEKIRMECATFLRCMHERVDLQTQRAIVDRCLQNIGVGEQKEVCLASLRAVPLVRGAIVSMVRLVDRANAELTCEVLGRFRGVPPSELSFEERGKLVEVCLGAADAERGAGSAAEVAAWRESVESRMGSLLECWMESVENRLEWFLKLFDRDEVARRALSGLFRSGRELAKEQLTEMSRVSGPSYYVTLGAYCEYLWERGDSGDLYRWLDEVLTEGMSEFASEIRRCELDPRALELALYVAGYLDYRIPLVREGVEEAMLGLLRRVQQPEVVRRVMSNLRRAQSFEAYADTVVDYILKVLLQRDCECAMVMAAEFLDSCEERLSEEKLERIESGIVKPHLREKSPHLRPAMMCLVSMCAMSTVYVKRYAGCVMDVAKSGLVEVENRRLAIQILSDWVVLYTGEFARSLQESLPEGKEKRSDEAGEGGFFSILNTIADATETAELQLVALEAVCKSLCGPESESFMLQQLVKKTFNEYIFDSRSRARGVCGLLDAFYRVLVTIPDSQRKLFRMMRRWAVKLPPDLEPDQYYMFLHYVSRLITAYALSSDAGRSLEVESREGPSGGAKRCHLLKVFKQIALFYLKGMAEKRLPARSPTALLVLSRFYYEGDDESKSRLVEYLDLIPNSLKSAKIARLLERLRRRILQKAPLHPRELAYPSLSGFGADLRKCARDQEGAGERTRAPVEGQEAWIERARREFEEINRHRLLSEEGGSEKLGGAQGLKKRAKGGEGTESGEDRRREATVGEGRRERVERAAEWASKRLTCAKEESERSTPRWEASVGDGGWGAAKSEVLGRETRKLLKGALNFDERSSGKRSAERSAKSTPDYLAVKRPFPVFGGEGGPFGDGECMPVGSRICGLEESAEDPSSQAASRFASSRADGERDGDSTETRERSSSSASGAEIAASRSEVWFVAEREEQHGSGWSCCKRRESPSGGDNSAEFRPSSKKPKFQPFGALRSPDAVVRMACFLPIEKSMKIKPFKFGLSMSNKAEQERLSRLITNVLGIKVRKIQTRRMHTFSHIVIEPGVVTRACLLGALAGSWIVSVNWVEQYLKQGKMPSTRQSERHQAYQLTHHIFKGKRVCLYNLDEVNTKTLKMCVQFDQGALVPTIEAASMVICERREELELTFKNRRAVFFTRTEIYVMLTGCSPFLRSCS